MKRLATTVSVSALAVGLIASGVAVGASPAAGRGLHHDPHDVGRPTGRFRERPPGGGGDLPRGPTSRAPRHRRSTCPSISPRVERDLRPERSLSDQRAQPRGPSSPDAGIDVSAGKTLTIEATAGGALTISGGALSAAIGAHNGDDLGTIIINGGTINVSTVWDGAGIGGANLSNAGGGSITINGGDITATAYDCGPGIGAGEYNTVAADITITGGTVTAHGSCGSPGIGGAAGASGGNITITGGVITATRDARRRHRGCPRQSRREHHDVGGRTDRIHRRQRGFNGAALGSGYTPGNGPLRAPGSLTLIGAGVPTATSGPAPGPRHRRRRLLPGPPGVVFTQTTQDGTATQPAMTHIVFARLVPPQITTPALAGGTVNQPYAQTVQATGTGPLTFAVAGGTLPPGLTLDPVSGVISGQPTQSGTFTVIVEATGPGGTDSRPYTIAIPAAPAPTSSPSPTSSTTPPSSATPASAPARAASTGPKRLAVTGVDSTPVIVAGIVGGGSSARRGGRPGRSSASPQLIPTVEGRPRISAGTLSTVSSPWRCRTRAARPAARRPRPARSSCRRAAQR